MCIGANEPGGPRRCANYERRTEETFASLQEALSEMKLLEEKITEAQQPSEPFSEGLHSQDGVLILEGKKKSLEAKIKGLSEKLAKQKAAHAEETERFGSIIKESVDNRFKENEPYLVLSPLNHKRVIDLLASGAYGEGKEAYIRKRLVPLKNDLGREHSYLSVGVIDVQFNDPALLKALEGAEEGSDYGFENPDKWLVGTEKLMEATLASTSGGRFYLSKKDTPEGKEPTAEIVKKDVFRLREVPYPCRKQDLDSFAWFVKRYPGNSAYSQKVREIADKGYVSAQDASVLIGAVSGWRRYVDEQEKKAKEAKERAISRHLGVVGGTLDSGVVTIQDVRIGESKFGGFYATFTGVDGEGNVLRWSDGQAPELVEGQKVVFSAEVKAHTEFRGQKQTQLKAPQVYRFIASPGERAPSSPRIVPVSRLEYLDGGRFVA